MGLGVADPNPTPNPFDLLGRYDRLALLRGQLVLGRGQLVVPCLALAPLVVALLAILGTLLVQLLPRLARRRLEPPG